MITSKLASLEARIARLESSLNGKTSAYKTATDFDYVNQEIKMAVKSIYGKKYRITSIKEGIRLDSPDVTVNIDLGFDYGIIKISVVFEIDRGDIQSKNFSVPDEEEMDPVVFESKVGILVENILKYLKSQLHPYSHKP